MWCLRGRNQSCKPEGLMRKDFMEEAGPGRGLRKGQGPGEDRVPEDQEWKKWPFRAVGAPVGHTLGSHGRNWQLPSVPSVRPSRSGTSWQTRLPTAAAKGE